MINGMTTRVQRDGWMVYDEGRPYSTPIIFATQAARDRWLSLADSWPERVVRRVHEGDIIPLHHPDSRAYIGYMSAAEIRAGVGLVI